MLYVTRSGMMLEVPRLGFRNMRVTQCRYDNDDPQVRSA